MLASTSYPFTNSVIEHVNLDIFQKTQCDILAQCIEDIIMNSKKYHMSFMLNIINNGTAIEMVTKLRRLTNNVSKRIVFERRKGEFKSLFDLYRIGISRVHISRIVKANV
jgi:predicted nucleic acid-binding OB-fold protein